MYLPPWSRVKPFDWRGRKPFKSLSFCSTAETLRFQHGPYAHRLLLHSYVGLVAVTLKLYCWTRPSISAPGTPSQRCPHLNLCRPLALWRTYCNAYAWRISFIGMASTGVAGGSAGQDVRQRSWLGPSKVTVPRENLRNEDTLSNFMSILIISRTLNNSSKHR